MKDDPSKDENVKKVERLKRINAKQKEEIDLLKEKNASLTLRNAAYTRLKMVEQLGESRSTLMVDASLFSNTFHAGDALLQSLKSDILDNAAFQDLPADLLPPGTFSNVKKVTFSNGDSLVLKTHKPDSFGFQSLAVLSHEHRILKFIGNHANMLSTVGLVQLKGSFSHVLSFEKGSTLFEMENKSISIRSLYNFKSIIEGVADGLNFLFEKGVIHNHLVPCNVIVNEGFAKLIGFTFACRVHSAKRNIKNVLPKFEDSDHLAPELFHGSRVSCGTDVYAFGVLLSRILKIRLSFPINTTFKSRVDGFAGECRYAADQRPPHIFLASKTKRMLYYKL